MGSIVCAASHSHVGEHVHKKIVYLTVFHIRTIRKFLDRPDPDPNPDPDSGPSIKMQKNSEKSWIYSFVTF